VIRSSCSTILPKLGSNVPFKRLRNLSLNLWTMTILKLTEGLGLNEPGVKVFDDSGFNEQQGMRKILTWYEVILKEKNRPLSR